MDTHRLLSNLSQRVLFQLVLVLIAVGVVIYVNIDFIKSFYLLNQQTNTGIIINAGIVSIFALGMLNVLVNLLRYNNEEKSLSLFVGNIESLKKDLAEAVPEKSIVSKRYATLKSIASAHGDINHNALAAMLTADESTRMGLARFINNILILTGVFGTIVSLSIALLGASDLIDSAASNLGGMGLVIHGMSTALSTTITAIVSYMIFGYFYLRLNDAQTHLLSGIEQLTSIYLLPQFKKTEQNISTNTEGLIKAILRSIEKMNDTQKVYHASAVTLNESITHQNNQIAKLNSDINSIKDILKEGFRLPAEK